MTNMYILSTVINPCMYPLEMTLACKWAIVIHVQEKSSLLTLQ